MKWSLALPELGLGAPLAERERGAGGVREASWVKQKQGCRGDRGEGLGDGKDPDRGCTKAVACSADRRRHPGTPGRETQPRGSRTDPRGDLGGCWGKPKCGQSGRLLGD